MGSEMCIRDRREALHSSDWDDVRVDTTEKRKGLIRAHRVLSTDYKEEGERSIRQNGEAISHAGVRSRFKAPCATERTIGAAVCKAGCEDDYKDVLADVQTVANRGILVAAQWAPDAMASQVAELQGLWKGGELLWCRLISDVPAQLTLSLTPHSGRQ